MPPASPDSSGEESLRAEAAAWFARMRAPDADRHRAALERWLAADPAHRSAYDRMALRWEQAALVGHTPSGRGRTGLTRAPRRVGRPMAYAALAASVVAIVALGAVLTLSPAPRPIAQRPAEFAGTAISSPVGVIRRVRLADGSVVTLDTGTRLEVTFAPGVRRLRLLAGRARFEVAHDTARPFIVAAGLGEVVATGTVFDVSLVGDRPRVRLIQGSVEVRRPGRNRPAAPSAVVRLRPGQVLPLDDRDVAATPAPAGQERWVTGMLNFDRTPLGAALAEANRYSARRIRLADPALADLRVTGGFRAGDPEALAAAIAAGFGLRVDRDSGGDIVLRKRE